MAPPNAMAAKERRDETASVIRRFGDEQSTLLDRFERLSFEAHLTRAMLSRSLSESSAGRLRIPAVVSPPLTAQVCQGRRGSGMNKKLKKLLMKPFKLFRRQNAAGGGKQESHHADPRDTYWNWKSFSRSLRFS